MEGSKELGLGLIFTAKFAEVTAALDTLKGKLQSFSKNLKGIGDASADTKKLGDAARQTAKDTDAAKEAAARFSAALKSSSGETIQYQKALSTLGREAGTSQIRFKDLTSALRAAESTILQTANTQFKSKQAAEEWASKVDRVKVAQAFMRDEMIRVDKQVLSATKGTKELVRIQDDLRKAFEAVGMPANVLIGQLGNQIKTLPELKAKLTDLSKTWALNNSATIEASKVIEKHASVMNQMGKNGDAWAASVNKNAVAQSFLRGEIVKANGEFLAYGKTSQQITRDIANLTNSFQASDTRVQSIVSKFGAGINTLDDFKQALGGIAKQAVDSTKATETLAKNQRALANGYPTLSTSVGYLNQKMAEGNISFNQASDILSKMKIRQIENNKAMEAAAKASAILAEQKDNLARKYKALGPVADKFIGMYGNEIKSIKDVTAALDSQVAKMKQKSTGTLKAIDDEKKMVQVHAEARESLGRLNQQVEAGLITQKKANDLAKEIKANSANEMLRQQVEAGVITQSKADEMLKKYTKSVSDNEKAATKAAAEANKLTNSLTNAANGANHARNYFQQLGYAVKQLAAWMPAAMVIAAVTQAFTAGARAVAEFDQSLKNLQAITQATNAETSMMGEKILEVSKITKYSATEIGAAMTTIGQAGFNAAQTMDIITPAAQLAQGALEKMDVTADLVTTTLTVFGLQSHEAARAADVLAAAANWSKANLQQLRTAMNYVGPVAKSAGISLEETAAAMMQLFNVGLKASTVGTSFRQLIGAIEAPTSKMRKALQEVGIAAEELNPAFERTKGKAQGLSGSLEVLNKVLKGDLQKSLHLFGIRVAGTALALSNLGEDGFKLLIEQAGTVGSAAKMAEIQMGGLQVSMKNTANVAKNLAITIGQPVGEAFKYFLNILKGVLVVMNTIAQTPFLKDVAVWVILTTSIMATAASLKYLYTLMTTNVMQKFILMMGPLITQLRLVAAAVVTNLAPMAAAGSTASKLGVIFGGLTLAVRTLWAAMMANPFVAVAMGVAAAITAMMAYDRISTRLLQRTEEMYYGHQKNVETLKFYSEGLKNASGNEVVHNRTLERLVQSYPELQAQLAKTNGSMKEQIAVVDAQMKKEQELAKSNLADYFKRLAKEYNSTKKEAETLRTAVKWASGELTIQQERVFSVTHFWTALTTTIRDYASRVLPGVDSAHKVLGERITKNKELTKEQEAAFIKIGVTIGQNGQTLKAYAEKSGISIGELTKRFPTLQKVIDATIAAQERLKKAGLGDKDAQEAADIIATMGDEWVEMYAKADNAQKAFIIDTARGYQKQEKDLVKSLENKELTRAQFDQKMIEAERQALEKVEKYQEDHYKKIESVVETAYKNKQKIIADMYARERELAESSSKQQLAILAATGASEQALSKKREELERSRSTVTLQRIKEEETAQLNLNAKKEELLKSFASKESNSADVQKRLLVKINQDKLQDDINTYTKSYEAYKAHLDKKIADVERWAAKVRSTQQEIYNQEVSHTQKIESLQDKVREYTRKSMDEMAQASDQMLQVREKQAKANEALLKMQQAPDEETYKRAYDEASRYADQALQLAESVSIKKVQINEQGERQIVEDMEATNNYRKSAAQQAIGFENELMSVARKHNDEKLAAEKAALQQSVDAMNAVSKSVTDLGNTLEGMNKKKIEVDTESVLLQVKKLAKDISEVETKLLIGFVEASSKESIDVAVKKVDDSIKNLTQSIAEKSADLKVSIVSENGEALETVIDRTNVKVKEFGESIMKDKPSLLISFEGEGSSKLPLSEKIAEMAGKFEEFRNNITASEGYDVLLKFKGDVMGETTDLSAAISAVQDQINRLTALTLESQPEIKLNATPALTSLQEVMNKISELVKDWAFKVIANVYGKDDVDDLKRSIDRLRDKTVTITTRYVSSGEAPRGYNKGGEIPGVGDTDTHPAILTPGEFVVRKSAVKKYGAQFFHMLNSMVAPIPSVVGSVLNNIPKAVPVPALAGPNIDPVNMGTINLSIGNESFPVQAPVSVLNELNTALRRMKKAGLQ